jgi:hypothetical protein
MAQPEPPSCTLVREPNVGEVEHIHELPKLNMEPGGPCRARALGFEEQMAGVDTIHVVAPEQRVDESLASRYDVWRSSGMDD